MRSCEWCEYKGTEWLLYQSLHWSVYLADRQDYVGRCILVLNRHCGSLSELDGSEWMELKTMIDRLEYIYKRGIRRRIMQLELSAKQLLQRSSTKPAFA